MSSKNAVLISTNEEKKFNVENDVLQYLCCQLINIKFIVKETCNIESNIDNLTEKIQNYLKNSFIFLLTGQNELVYKTLAKLFDEKLIVSKHLASIYNITTFDSENVKEISVPRNSKIFQVENHVNGINPSCIQFKNIFVLPSDFNSVKVILQNILLPLLTEEMNNETLVKNFVFNCDQNGSLSLVNDKFAEFTDTVKISRYCIVKSEDNCELNVKLSSKNLSKFVECENVLKSVVSSKFIMSNIDESFWDRFQILRAEPYVDEALKIISTCYHEYQPQDIFLCFNGGKDCTITLYLTLYVLHTVYPIYNERLICVYLETEEPFDEVVEFIEQCRTLCNLELYTVKCTSIKNGLADILHRFPNLNAVLMGTRRSDPCTHATHFALTDPDWPTVMRVFPILDWKYSEVWTFILTCNIPYCNLYNNGYTSVGGIENTVPNPALKYEVDGVVKYLPAYKLNDENLERKNRIENLKSSSKIENE